MTAQHTPGPWHVGFKPGPIVYDDRRGRQVADCRDVTQSASKEAIANARLIAAAPELLEMLYTVLPSVEEADEFNKPTKKLGPVVRRLIAKIEGGK